MDIRVLILTAISPIAVEPFRQKQMEAVEPFPFSNLPHRRLPT